MERTDIRNFLDKHCRFRLRSGKEVFGVLWEDKSELEPTYFFSSAGDREKPYRHDLKNTALSVDPDDIIFAEALRDQLAS